MMMREKTIGSRYAPVTEAQHQAARKCIEDYLAGREIPEKM